MFFIESSKIKDWISLSSGDRNMILRDTLYREQVEKVSKWVWVASKPFLTSLREFFLHISGFRLFLLFLQLNHLSTCYALLFSKLRENTQGMAVLTRREVDDGVRATLRFLSKVDFLPFFQSWFKGFKKGFNSHSERLNTHESQVDE